MEQLRKGGQSSLKLPAMMKRIIITKAVADTHEFLARNGGFKRAFIATGTWLPMDHSADDEVSLQGVDFVYKDICTSEAIEIYKKKLESLKAEKEAEEQKKAKIASDKVKSLSALFAHAQKLSEVIWSEMLSLAREATEAKFCAIATHVGSSFICAGSFPASVVADIYKSLSNTGTRIHLMYNDIDVYYGRFGEGEINRLDCSYTNISGLEEEVNLINCSHLNTAWLLNNSDINAVALCVHVHVRNNKVQLSEWIISPEFWHFLIVDQTLRSWRTDSPARTLVRLAFKSYQLKLPFSTSSLSLLDGIVFASHQKKVKEMESKWKDYPFSDYKLKKKSRKSFHFIRFRAVCECGRKANLRCDIQKCAKCCVKDENTCKVHVVKK